MLPQPLQYRTPLQRGPESAPAILARGEAVGVGGMITHEGDALMTTRQQMARCEFPAMDVVDYDVREAGMRDVEKDGRQLVPGERLHLVIQDRQRDEQQARDTAPSRQIANRVGARLGRL